MSTRLFMVKPPAFLERMWDNSIEEITKDYKNIEKKWWYHFAAKHGTHYHLDILGGFQPLMRLGAAPDTNRHQPYCPDPGQFDGDVISFVGIMNRNKTTLSTLLGMSAHTLHN